jgi:hypothetical protein
MGTDPDGESAPPPPGRRLNRRLRPCRGKELGARARIDVGLAVVRAVRWGRPRRKHHVGPRTRVKACVVVVAIRIVLLGLIRPRLIVVVGDQAFHVDPQTDGRLVRGRYTRPAGLAIRVVSLRHLGKRCTRVLAPRDVIRGSDLLRRVEIGAAGLDRIEPIAVVVAGGNRACLMAGAVGIGDTVAVDLLGLVVMGRTVCLRSGGYVARAGAGGEPGAGRGHQGCGQDEDEREQREPLLSSSQQMLHAPRHAAQDPCARYQRSDLMSTSCTHAWCLLSPMRSPQQVSASHKLAAQTRGYPIPTAISVTTNGIFRAAFGKESYRNLVVDGQSGLIRPSFHACRTAAKVFRTPSLLRALVNYAATPDNWCMNPCFPGRADRPHSDEVPQSEGIADRSLFAEHLLVSGGRCPR